MQLSVRQDTISHEAALAAVSAAVRKGLELGCAVNVAVLDAGGNLAAFVRASGAFLHSITIAQDKAYTAVGFGLPSGQLYDLVKDNPALRDGIGQRERLVWFGGGFPIRVDGRVIGGIGVSGGSEEQDCICAEAGLAALGLPHNP